jgi:hypothetical protein
MNKKSRKQNFKEKRFESKNKEQNDLKAYLNLN